MLHELLKEWCIEKNVDIRLDEPMSKHTSLKIGGTADVALFPSPSDLSEILRIVIKAGMPYVVVGGGTNILVRDGGIEGAVVFTSKMNKINTELLTPASELITVTVQAGCSLQKIINLCVEKGLSGIEGLAGIPGSVGGAVAGNAGSYGCEIKDVITSVDLLLSDGSVKTLTNSEIGFEYRKSRIPSNAVILSATIALKKNDPAVIKKRVSEYVREKKASQPVSQRSAGCVFKNPSGASAGRLIDEAGCKGLKAGGVEVSSLHANFFINTGNGTADDFLRLMDMVTGKVKERFGIVLEPEIRILGRA